jgi:hypothetical protein
MFVPALAGTNSGEVGHPAYQHPQRLREGIYNLEVDRFPALVIATALRCLLVGGRQLWERYDNGDNMLFRQEDFEAPSRSVLFYELLKLNDSEARCFVDNLIEAARKPLDQTPLLLTLVSDNRVRVAPDQGQQSQLQAESKAIPYAFAAGEPVLEGISTGSIDSDNISSTRQEGKQVHKRSRLAWKVLACGVGLLALIFGASHIGTKEPAKTGLDQRNREEPPSATKLSGLIAYWSFDEGDGANGVDASGRVMKANLYNVSRVQGIRGRALSFSGPGSYFDYGDSPELSFKAKAPFTMAFWVQTRISNGTLLSHRNSRNGTPVIDILISDGRTRAQVRCDGNADPMLVQIDGKSVNDEKWHHVALTRDGDIVELFLDSVSQGRKGGAAGGGAITTNLRSLGSERLWINHPPGPGDPHFQGSIDEFYIFSRALKAEEITTLAGR